MEPGLQRVDLVSRVRVQGGPAGGATGRWTPTSAIFISPPRPSTPYAMTLFASLSPASASRVSTVLNKPLLASPVTHLLGPRWTWPMLWARVPCVFGSVVWTYKRLPTIERIETSPTPFSMSRKAELSHNRLTTSAHNQPVSATATTNGLLVIAPLVSWL